MAGLGSNLQSHLLVVLGHQAVQEAACLLGDALLPAVDAATALHRLLAVPAQTNLTHHALEQLAHVVVQGGRRLDELTVKHHGAGTALWGETPGGGGPVPGDGVGGGLGRGAGRGGGADSVAAVSFKKTTQPDT